jgi:PPOX class probable F420-dependent enzyme
MTIPESHADLLDQVTLAQVATIGPGGEPQVNPVWFEWVDGSLQFSQTRSRQKLKNLERDPRVAITIVDPQNPYRYLEIRGRVASVVDDDDNAFIDRQAKRYLDQDSYPFHQPGDERVVVSVTPEHTTQMG